ncbi:pseudouridine synthase [Pelomonas sp. CA6]|uniref:pseudouridine synthase n=1 Tax=Pelomonas sp. CA6 TaxID=2907999 RepID=UPI001F4C0BA2|nr:pseudouridine synthase [Pelomonas sp. CA6]MCH7345431.1 pseudouridine synthase [Pelomonas sp. CA6]
MSRPARPALPLRDGVAASSLACPPGAWPLLLDFIAERLPLVAREDWARRMDRGDVVDAQGKPLAAATPYRGGQRIHYWRWLEAEPELPFEARVLHLDEHLLVADKPHFMPVTPKGRWVQQTLLTQLRRQTGLAELSPIHRLDRETAGLTLFSVRRQDRDAYQRLFRERSVLKVYEAIAGWRADLALPRLLSCRLEEHPEDFMQMRAVAGEPNALTRLALIERLPGGCARYELRPQTGAKHQLRAQMCLLGLPIDGDRIYPVLQPVETTPDFSRPLQLLAREIAFTDPLDGRPRHFRTGLRLAGHDAALCPA